MERQSRLNLSLPAEVEEAARRLGHDIRLARRRRRLSEGTLAERMLVTRPTLRKLERGDPTVKAAVVYAALWALGLLDQLAPVADPSRDEVALGEDLRRATRRGGGLRKPDVDF